MSRVIVEEKEKIDKNIENIELDKNEFLSENIEEIKKIEQEISFNNEENIYRYIFIDKYNDVKEIEQKSLQMIEFLKEMKTLPLEIEKINVDNEKLKIIEENNKTILKTNILESDVQIENDGNKYVVKAIKDALNLDINYEIMSGNIFSKITYLKNDLIDKEITLVANILFSDKKLKIENKTKLNSEEKILLDEKNKYLEISKYDDVIQKYIEKNNEIDKNIDALKENLKKLDDLQKDVMKFDKQIVVESNNLGYMKPTEKEKTETEKKENNTGKGIQDLIIKMMGKK